MKRRIFVHIHYLEMGGAERALIGLLDALDPTKYDVDLMLNQHTGAFMRLIPEHVNLLPQLPEYSAIERPIKDIVREGHLSMAARRLLGKWRYRHGAASIPGDKVDESIFQYIARAVSPALRDLSYLGTYDLAISFLHPHNIVRDKVKARHKICWVHTDYSTVYINRALEQPVWEAYDHIACISDAAREAFGTAFPSLREKLLTIENILTVSGIRAQAEQQDVSAEMPREDDVVNILSIGRYCQAKRFDEIPKICSLLHKQGTKARWYIIGLGDDRAIQEAIREYGMEDWVTLIGARANPYPYIKACDIYAQPSLYEGKSVTVREAQILCRPVVISAYPTSSSQVVDGVDGVIAPLDIEGYAQRLSEVINDSDLQQRIIAHLSTHDYGNATEIAKVESLV